MLPETALYIIAAGLILFGYMKWTDKKKDIGQFSIAIGALLAVAVLAGGLGLYAPLTAAPAEAPIYVVEEPIDVEVAKTICDKTGALVYSQLNFSGDTWAQTGANSPTGPSGTLSFYLSGADVTLPGATALDTISITSGVGGTTSGVLKSCTPYEIWYDGGATDYDVQYGANQIPPILTDAGIIANQVIEVRSVQAVASLSDILEEDSTDGRINGQSNVSGLGAFAIQVGTDGTPADGDTMYYSIGNASDTFYLDLTIEVSGGDKVGKDMVLCPVRLANPMEGTEFSQVLMNYRSGNTLDVPSVDVTAYFTNHECIPLGDMIGGESAEYRLNFNVVEANFATDGTDILYLYLDDLGGYQETDVFHNLKAAATGLQLQAEA